MVKQFESASKYNFIIHTVDLNTFEDITKPLNLLLTEFPSIGVISVALNYDCASGKELIQQVIIL